MLTVHHTTLVDIRPGRAPIVIEELTDERRAASLRLGGLRPLEVAATLAGLSYGKLSGAKVERNER